MPTRRFPRQRYRRRAIQNQQDRTRAQPRRTRRALASRPHRLRDRPRSHHPVRLFQPRHQSPRPRRRTPRRRQSRCPIILHAGLSRPDSPRPDVQVGAFSSSSPDLLPTHLVPPIDLRRSKFLTPISYGCALSPLRRRANLRPSCARPPAPLSVSLPPPSRCRSSPVPPRIRPCPQPSPLCAKRPSPATPSPNTTSASPMPRDAAFPSILSKASSGSI